AGARRTRRVPGLGRGSVRRRAGGGTLGGGQPRAPDAQARLAVTAKGSFVDHVQLSAPLVDPGRLEPRQEPTARDVRFGNLSAKIVTRPGPDNRRRKGGA